MPRRPVKASAGRCRPASPRTREQPPPALHPAGIRAGREAGKELVESYYADIRGQGDYKGCDTYVDYRDMLGAAGANEIAFLWLALQDREHLRLPPHLWDGVPDPDIPGLNVAGGASQSKRGASLMMSNSFAFGGNNICVLLGRE